MQFRDYLLAMLKVTGQMSTTATPSNSQHALSEAAKAEGDEKKEEEKKEETEEKKDEKEKEEKKEGEAEKEGEEAPATNGVAPEGPSGPAVGNPADFNLAFLKLLKETRHFKAWRTGLPEYGGLAEVSSLHPSHGHFKLDDLQLRINQ